MEVTALCGDMEQNKYLKKCTKVINVLWKFNLWSYEQYWFDRTSKVFNYKVNCFDVYLLLNDVLQKKHFHI